MKDKTGKTENISQSQQQEKKTVNKNSGDPFDNCKNTLDFCLKKMTSDLFAVLNKAETRLLWFKKDICFERAKVHKNQVLM